MALTTFQQWHLLQVAKLIWMMQMSFFNKTTENIILCGRATHTQLGFACSVHSLCRRLELKMTGWVDPFDVGLRTFLVEHEMKSHFRIYKQI